MLVSVHGLSGTRRAQTFSSLPYEPKSSPGTTHGRPRLPPGPRTFSFREYYELQSYFCTCRATPSRRRRARRRPATPPWAPWACVGPARHARGPFRAGCAMRPRCPAPPQMGMMGPHAPYEARRVVLMAGYGTLDRLGAHARARMARGGRGGHGPSVPKKEIQFFRNLQAVFGTSSYRMGDSYRDSSKPHVKF